MFIQCETIISTKVRYDLPIFKDYSLGLAFKTCFIHVRLSFSVLTSMRPVYALLRQFPELFLFSEFDLGRL